MVGFPYFYVLLSTVELSSRVSSSPLIRNEFGAKQVFRVPLRHALHGSLKATTVSYMNGSPHGQPISTKVERGRDEVKTAGK